MSAHEDLSNYIPVGNVRRMLPSSHFGKRLAKSTIWRWCMRGTRARKLRTVRIGAGVYTTSEWINDFVEHLGTLPAPQAQTRDLNTRRLPPRAKGQSSAKLDRLGFK